MGNENAMLSPQTRQALESKCRSAARRVGKAAPGPAAERRLARDLENAICKEVDEQLLAKLAVEIAGFGAARSAKKVSGSPPKVQAGLPNFKLVDKSARSATVPLSWLSSRLGTNRKLELQIWEGPKKGDHGGMLTLTVRLR